MSVQRKKTLGPSRASPIQPKVAQAALEAMSPKSLGAVRLILTTTWQELWAEESTKHSVAVKPFSFCGVDSFDTHPAFCMSSGEHRSTLQRR